MRDKINIIYEDEWLIVAHKPSGIATQTSKMGEKDVESLLKNHIYKDMKIKKQPYLAVIHRLDQPVEGLLVFAKDKNTAKALNQQLTSKGFGKEYKAIVCGTLPKDEGTLRNYVMKNAKENKAYICQAEDEGAKEAILHYQVLEKREDQTSLVYVALDTGRFHQIRVQMAHIGCPLLGDAKYNPATEKKGKWEKIALCAFRLRFKHPKTGKEMVFEVHPLTKM